MPLVLKFSLRAAGTLSQNTVSSYIQFAVWLLSVRCCKYLSLSTVKTYCISGQYRANCFYFKAAMSLCLHATRLLYLDIESQKSRKFQKKLEISRELERVRYIYISFDLATHQGLRLILQIKDVGCFKSRVNQRIMCFDWCFRPF